MSKKRQRALLDPRGNPRAQVTTLSYEYANGHLVVEHFHKEHQLVFASAGVMTLRTAEGLWVVPTQRAIWIPGGVAHSIQMSGRVSMRTLYFAPKFRARLPARCSVLHVGPLLRELIVSMCELRALRTSAPRQRHLIELVIDLIENAATIPLVLPSPQEPRAARLAELLAREPGNSGTLASLCRQTGASKRTIERVFVEELGMTVGRWRQQLRLLHAIRLLAAGDKVIDAAIDSGYRSPSAFISAFKKAFGLTPKRLAML